MLSQKAQYAFRALTYLADHYDEGPVLIADIAEKKRIPIKFLESILLQLKKAQILDSKKGKGGGYFIRQHPSETSIAAIIRTVDGPIAMLPCVSLYFYQRCANCDEQNCGLHNIMEQVRDATLQILENKTIADLKSGQEDLPGKIRKATRTK
ncbi:Rrf2 family transcriptional regulator [Flaviaesturariibacter amylovorans]|uniref:Rrf2 family transcriptional regulator n=1 Tax=Flaviaesturariibacter amylovorans TaxID=1084520 RepID=A0ABP8G8W5_9BACT